MSDDEITAEDVRAGLRALADSVPVCLTIGADDVQPFALLLVARALDHIVTARDRRLSERTMLEAEARADAEREDLR